MIKRFASNIFNWITLFLIVVSLIDKQWSAAAAWTCVLLADLKFLVVDEYSKWLEGDRDVWYKKFIENKYGS